ncbi:UNKNOWN [Stylonychia lemnae]|uniref:Uncharacterized protein n=1 Tax=Stylonychia lemnae TaxID=5949 RepID=A0A078AYN0_STYLE|nr:UNKNOWN [Stylonychia lemnae]CDW85873.1 UNKNOWN [Stylonychia lemnae]|eukprot:CDW85859.1 UNKNOWN [Stylonychia lemnae]
MNALKINYQHIILEKEQLEDDAELNQYRIQKEEPVKISEFFLRDFNYLLVNENSIELVIPDILKNEGICQRKIDNFQSDFHQSLDKESQVIELLPHDKFLKRTVELKIKALPQANYAIFIQKNNQHAKELDIWRTIPCQSEEDGLLKLHLNSFSFMFISSDPKGQFSVEEKKTEQELKQSNVKFHKFLPGLNFVVSKPCSDECRKAQDFPTYVLSSGYVTEFHICDLDKYKCPCGDELSTYQISQIIIMQAEAKIQYALDLGPGKKTPTQKTDIVAKGNDIMVIGNGCPIKYKKFTISVVAAATDPQDIKDLAKAGFLQLDENGNAIGKMFQLNNDSGVCIKVLVGKFYNGEGFTLESFKQNAGKDLRENNFQVEITQNLDQFVKLIKDGKYSSAMIISDHISQPFKCTQAQKNEYVEAVYTFWKKGNGLMIFEENDTTDDRLSNIALRKLLGFTLHGNDPGCQVLIPSTSIIPEKGKFSVHEIFTGIVGKIHEGVTIARPKGVLPPSIQVIAKSSSDKPCIMCYDDQNFGRVVIDTGFTKLYQQFYKKTAGTSKYIQNAVVWINRANLS